MEEVFGWYLKCLKQYADFEGRARRKEYWMFALVNFLISLALGYMEKAFHMTLFGSDFGIISTLYSLFVFVPGLAVAIRRLHDINKSGWWYLLMLLPIIGWIWLIVLFCKDSTPGSNQWGPNPKGIDSEVEATEA